MTTAEQWLTLAIVVAGTMTTRYISFMVFPSGRKVPDIVSFFGGVLPAAVMGMLVVYTLQYVDWLDAPYGLPEMMAVAGTAILHVWRRNMMLSIAAGTLGYMYLVQVVFG